MSDARVMEFALAWMIMDRPTPPHIELLGAPDVRPFEEALAETKARWVKEVERYREISGAREARPSSR